MTKSPSLSTASLDWPNGQPHSVQYGDVYFSVDSGLEESRHVFLQHNDLAQRWQQLTQPQFTIVETGFGTGLNFLLAWRMWCDVAPAQARLHFVSCERHPLSPADLQRALAMWPTLASEASALQAQYQLLCAGWHRLEFAGGRVILTLLVGDIAHTLPLLNAHVDAWFLDGFAPAKNPDMWQDSLYQQMARLSHGRTSFATFTSAGMVRRGLQAAGFVVDKVAGYGRKREMLRGRYAGPAMEAVNEGRRAIVIGGGIAGTSSAYALAQRGWQVTLLERHPALAQAASGNPVGILYPRLSGSDINLSRLALQGYLHSIRLLQGLDGAGINLLHACGVLQLAFNAREQARCEAVVRQGLPPSLVTHVDAAQASELAGVALAYGGLHFPQAGWLDPRALCHQLSSHPLIQCQLATSALQLTRQENIWQVDTEPGERYAAEVVIIASATDSMAFSQTAHCPLQPVRGQVSMLAQTPASAALRSVLCSDGYINPASKGVHCIGATFDEVDLDTGLRNADHQANLDMLLNMMPQWQGQWPQADQLQGRAALRSSTPDYLPMAGQLLDASAMPGLRMRHTANPATLPWLPGLYINAGHGAKGLVNAPLCADIIASAICGEPAPVDAGLLAALDPNRFLLRSLGLKKLVHGLAASAYAKISA